VLGPIFNREWLTVPRRTGHYVVRVAYFGALWVLGLTAWQAVVGWSQEANLADNARFGLLLFHVLTLVQLLVVPFIAALSAASAVSQEKDRRTFILLLLTDLRSHEIVVGKLLGSLLQIALLLLGMVPVLALILLLGGIAPEQVGQAALVIGSAALAAGSLGTLIALWREKTFQVLAMTVLVMVLYLCFARALPTLAELAGVHVAATATWPAWFDPFRALAEVLDAAPDDIIGLPPAVGFAAVMGGITLLLNAWGIWKLRVWNPSGEPVQQRERKEDEDETKDRVRAHAAPGRVRNVRGNPILWREIFTRAYGRRSFLVKLSYFLAVALVGYYALSPLLIPGGGRTPFLAAYGIVPIVILSLLLIAAQSVTAITSERDTGALDLLLVTDLTPKEFIFGKLGGILYNSKEYLIPPLALVIVYGVMGLLASPSAKHPELSPQMNREAGICVVVGILVMFAFVAVLGIHVALRADKSRTAVLQTLATVLFLSVGTLVCIYLILINGRFEAQWTSFILYVVASIGGLWWVLNGDRPSSALTLASWLCPVGILYLVMSVLVAKPGSQESADPLLPFIVVAGGFGFTITAMLVPLLSEFDVALGRTSAGGD
jgi:ABC-type transport system involved in multi-copper enzyme maturation permease subunit